MDQTEEKELPITTTPELEENKNALKKAPKKRSYLLWGFIWVVILINAASIGYLYWQWKASDQQIHRLEQNLAQIQSLLNQQSNTLQSQQDTLHKLVQEVQQKEGDQLLIEVENKLDTAALHLTFEDNIPLARQLLEIADKQIAQNPSAELLPLREALAQDIGALNSDEFDLPGLLTRLSGLQEQAGSLTQFVELSHPALPTREPTSDASESKFISLSKRFLESLKTAFSNIVVISKDDHANLPLLTTGQHIYLVTNLQSQLLLAEWAAIHHQESAYNQSLLQIENWLNDYFSEKDPSVQKMLKTIAELKDKSIAPALPDIHRSLEALKKVRNP